jgi:ankyrin repeat protein
MEIELKSILGIRQLINIAMEYACKRGQTSLIKCLVQHTFINVNNTSAVDTLLHDAIWRSEHDKTQLHKLCIAPQSDVLDVCKLVLNFDDSAALNAQDNNGDTPLHIACSYGYGDRKRTDIIEALLAFGADVNITNDRKQTPAQAAVYDDFSELLPLLHGINTKYILRQLRSSISVFMIALYVGCTPE